MARRRISQTAGDQALTTWVAAQSTGGTVDRATLATAVRYLLEELAEQHPGHSVEVRVPPFGVTQCVEGPTHTRGTPPNVVELPAQVWLELATARLKWDQARALAGVQASGTRADLSAMVPLVRM